MNSSKPPAKSWSDLLSPNPTNPAPNPPPSVNLGAGKSCSASESNSSGPSRPTSALSLEIDFEALEITALDSEFLNKPVSIHSRPIVNPGNRCYMISVLQALLHTRPFTNYLQKYFFKLELLSSVLATGKFPLLSALKSFYSHFSALNSGPVSTESIDEIFLALNRLGTFSFSEQEDAEEFLTSFLDTLGEEFVGIQSQKLLPFSLPYGNSMENASITSDSNSVDDDWLQVGPKQRVATTRRTPVNQSPIHSLFSGSFQSLYRAPGIRPSITFEPFTVLSLSLVQDGDLPIDSITGAIEHVLRSEDLGKKCSKQLSFSSLPPILIIQLKRFIYKQSPKYKELELNKLTRPIKISTEIHLNQNSTNLTYRLYALVNHHGSSIHNGHYTATIKKEGWMNFNDDARLQTVNVENVTNQNSTAYLLFYERQ